MGAVRRLGGWPLFRRCRVLRTPGSPGDEGLHERDRGDGGSRRRRPGVGRGGAAGRQDHRRAGRTRLGQRRADRRPGGGQGAALGQGAARLGRGRLVPRRPVVGRRAVPARGRQGPQRDPGPRGAAGRAAAGPGAGARHARLRRPGRRRRPGGRRPVCPRAGRGGEAGQLGAAALRRADARRRRGRARGVDVPGAPGRLRDRHGGGGAQQPEAAADPDLADHADDPDGRGGLAHRGGPGQGCRGRHGGRGRRPSAAARGGRRRHRQDTVAARPGGRGQRAAAGPQPALTARERDALGAPLSRRAQARDEICCTAQPLPSGSVKKTNPTLSSGSGTGRGFSPTFCTSLTGTPRATSSACAWLMSGTTSCSPLSEPGGMSGTAPLPMTIEQPEPGGVSCTIRMSALIVVS